LLAGQKLMMTNSNSKSHISLYPTAAAQQHDFSSASTATADAVAVVWLLLLHSSIEAGMEVCMAC
jgi:hypothetical protein